KKKRSKKKFVKSALLLFWKNQPETTSLRSHKRMTLAVYSKRRFFMLSAKWQQPITRRFDCFRHNEPKRPTQFERDISETGIIPPG
ncbi:MAG: hypothetical protein K0U89_03895, partial [Planctomycetes bacterium]|nr:hypothetical protein [Planctomycetota bacterium]